MSELFDRFGKSFRAGEVLFREGDPGDVMYVLQKGIVRISKRAGGEEKMIALLGAGEFFGEMAILNDKPRTATATVVEEAECLVIDRWRLEAMVATSAEIGLRLIKKLARRLDSANALIEIVLHKNPKARIILGLARHAEAFGKPGDDGVQLLIDPDQLAQEVGVEASTVHTLLRRLQRLKLIDQTAEGLVVRDLDQLREFLELLEMPKRFDRGGREPPS